MPELPEVEAIRRSLHPMVSGRRCTSFDLLLPRILKSGEPKLLVGQRFIGVDRRGKHLLFRTETETILYGHLGMTGTMFLSQKTPEDLRFARAIIGIEGGRIVFRDIRTLGALHISDATHPPWKTLAPDPLAVDFNAAGVSERIRRSRIWIKPLLLDQGVLSGVGNIYASEALFRAEVDPTRRGADLTISDVDGILAATKQILLEAIEASGTTFRDFRLTDGRKGEFKNFLRVYGRAGEPCTNCGEAIQRIVQAGRSTFYCPRCQR